MTKQLTLYILLVTAVALQLLLMQRIPWTPDIILAMVVFAGIFRGPLDGVLVGLAAGLIRGLFSAETLFIDILLFPAVGLLSAVLTNLFYGQNTLSQVILTFIAMVTVIITHTVYFNALAGNDVSVARSLFRSSGTIFTTLAAAPFIFFYLRDLWRGED